MFISISRSNQGRLSDNNSDSGLCVVLNAANLAQLSPRVLTKSGIENLIHEMINHSSLLHFFAKQHLFHKTQVPNLTLETS